MDYSIYDVDEGQIDEIERIEKDCFSMPWTREQLLQQRSDDTHIFLAAYAPGVGTMGYVGMAIVLDEGYISNVAVTPQHRRSGVADALLNELEARADKRELSFMTLEVRAGNSAAIALYKKHGFIPVGERKNYYSRPSEDAVLMTKFLK